MSLKFKTFNDQAFGHAALSLMSRSSVKKARACLTPIPSGSYNRRASSPRRERGNFAWKMGDLTHFNKAGRARMVDVSQKASTERAATAQARVSMLPETLALIRKGKIAKGDVLAVAQVAGVMGAKRTPDLIPMCHPLLISSVDLSFQEEPRPDREGRCAILVTATVKTTGQTGVEMEAMTAVSIAALTIYDMCKAVDKGITFGDICLLSKSGGKSGVYTRP
jgi:cyclic pyranopterin phosphate synthase